MSQNKMRNKKSDYGFESIHDAIMDAMENHPVSPKTIQQIRNMCNQKFRTKDDFRWFVLFNVLFSLARQLQPGIDDAYLLQIQDNIRLSAELYMD